MSSSHLACVLGEIRVKALALEGLMWMPTAALQCAAVTGALDDTVADTILVVQIDFYVNSTGIGLVQKLIEARAVFWLVPTASWAAAVITFAQQERFMRTYIWAAI